MTSPEFRVPRHQGISLTLSFNHVFGGDFDLTAEGVVGDDVRDAVRLSAAHWLGVFVLQFLEFWGSSVPSFFDHDGGLDLPVITQFPFWASEILIGEEVGDEKRVLVLFFTLLDAARGQKLQLSICSEPAGKQWNLFVILHPWSQIGTFWVFLLIHKIHIFFHPLFAIDVPSKLILLVLCGTSIIILRTKTVRWWACLTGF